MKDEMSQRLASALNSFYCSCCEELNDLDCDEGPHALSPDPEDEFHALCNLCVDGIYTSMMDANEGNEYPNIHPLSLRLAKKIKFVPADLPE